MRYNLLGRSALKVSEICFGCMSLAGGINDNQRIIDRAVAMGINFFDTADLYDKGENERALGRMIRPKRKELVLATKVGNQWRSDGSGWDWNAGKDYILRAVEESLRRLQTDYIDLYQLHGGTMEDRIDETIEAFERLVKEGKIRYYGISSIRPEVIRTYLADSNISSVMMQYGLLDRRPEEQVMALLEEKRVSVLARGALGKGLLAGKAAAPFLDYSAEEVGRAAKAVESVSGAGRSAAQTAIRFALANAVVSSAVVGIRTLAQCEEAAAASESAQLSKKELDILSASLPVNKYTQYR